MFKKKKMKADAAKQLVVDAMVGICAHDPDVYLTPPSDIKSIAADSLTRGLNNASLSNDAKAAYLITQGGVNFAEVSKNAERDLPNQMETFMAKNGLKIENYELKFFSDKLRDDIKVFWVVAARKN